MPVIGQYPDDPASRSSGPSRGRGPDLRVRRTAAPAEEPPPTPGSRSGTTSPPPTGRATRCRSATARSAPWSSAASRPNACSSTRRHCGRADPAPPATTTATGPHHGPEPSPGSGPDRPGHPDGTRRGRHQRSGSRRPASARYQNLADIYLDMTGTPATVSGYRRELDLAEATARVGYSHGGVTYQREYFASHPRNVIVARLSASQARQGLLRPAYRLGPARQHRHGGERPDHRAGHTARQRADPRDAVPGGDHRRHPDRRHRPDHRHRRRRGVRRAVRRHVVRRHLPRPIAAPTRTPG